MYEFETVLGTQKEKPTEIDTTSSQYVVYIREDIQRYETEGDEYSPPFKGWKYRECVIPNNDFLADFVKQLVEENKELKQQNEALKEQINEGNQTLMLGMVDLYEMNLGA